MQIKGTLQQILKMESGVSKAGKEWKKQDFVVVTNEQFPKTVCFTLFGEKVSLINGIKEGLGIEVYFNLESREFNGKWYHNINAWKIDVDTNQAQQSTSTSGSGLLPPTEHATQGINEQPDDSDLPF